MLIVGLTGTVASGKNFVADLFARLGAVIFDADKEVHKIFEENIEALNQIKKFFPQAIQDNKIDRKKLGNLVFNNSDKLNILEKIIHPIVKEQRENFIKKARSQREKLIILNIPLLFEKNIHLSCHKNILVTAPKLIQKQRFLKREKLKFLTEKSQENLIDDLLIAKFDNILQNQMPNSRKAKLADFIIKNGQDKAFTFRQVMKIFNKLKENE